NRYRSRRFGINSPLSPAGPNHSFSRRRLSGIFKLAAVAVLLLFGNQVAKADSVILDDHGTGPCWWNDYPNRGDYVTMHLTVVTGNVWNHDDTNPFFDLRLSYDGGTEPIGGFYIPLGAPAGTVIADFDYVHGYPFCAVPADNTHIFGFPNGLYVANTGLRRGDAAGSGLVITYTNSGDCGPTGGGCAVAKTVASQVWTVWDGPADPTAPPSP